MSNYKTCHACQKQWTYIHKCGAGLQLDVNEEWPVDSVEIDGILLTRSRDGVYAKTTIQPIVIVESEPPT